MTLHKPEHTIKWCFSYASTAAAWFVLKLIRAYQYFISPLSPPSCGFYPTCSAYALEAVEIHGALKGSWLGIKRICRCHPYSNGGIDPVPGSAMEDWEQEVDEELKANTLKKADRGKRKSKTVL